MTARMEAHIGDRIRRARKAAGLSQEELGAALGVTFQQIQKFESGKDRIKASQLFVASGALGVDMGFFFDALPPKARATRRRRKSS